MAKKKADRMISDLLADLVESPQDIEYVELFGKTWGFRQITTKDHIEVLRNTQKFAKDDMARVFGFTVEYLRLGLVSVEGIILTDDQKDELLENISPAMLNALYYEYDKVRYNHQQKLEGVTEETEEETESEEETEEEEEVVVKKKSSRATLDA
jgi:hypothetical protein